MTMRLTSIFLLAYLIAYFAVAPLVMAQGMGQNGIRRNDIGIGQPSIPSRNSVKSFGSSGTEDEVLQSLSAPMGIGMPGGLAGKTSIYYTVHILGEVKNPGSYKILPSDRLTDALMAAGGVLPNGSERTVQLRRSGSSRALDLFLYKYKGNLDFNPYLTENDVIFVPVKKGEFEIEGPVNRPGNYELTRAINLKEAVHMAGGFTSGLSLKETIRVVRFDSDEKKKVIEVENNNAALTGFKIQRGDVVVIPHVLIADKEFDYNLKRIPGDNIFYPTVDGNVYVMGAVLQPGAFAFEPNFSYKEYVSLAGATERSKLKSIRVVRRSGEKVLAKGNTIINPGDTIIVPQRYWKAETVVSWLSTVASLTLSSIIITDRFKN